MMLNSRLIFFLAFLCSTGLSAQSGFIRNQQLVFNQSKQQWIAGELYSLNKIHFSCESKNNTWKIPSDDSCKLFGKSVYIEESLRNQFQELLFPSGECAQYLILTSLCDLYFPLFRKDITAQKLHEDYRILPLLLSGCNQSFEDRNGHAGLWAMDFLVARKYHLRVDTLIDERKGGDFTTHVAIQYLGELRQKFDDDFLATLAYIKGVPYVMQLVQSSEKGEYYSTLDNESRVFFQFYAFLHELLAGTRTDNQLNFYFDIMANYESIALEKKLHYQALNEILHVDVQQLRQFNPVYTGAYLEPGYRKVPFMIDKVAALKFEAMHDSLYRWEPHPVRPPQTETFEEFYYYKVKRGDSLGKIADRHGVSIKEIKKWNNLKSDKISKGQKLKLARQIRQTKKEENLVETSEDKKPEVTQQTTAKPEEKNSGEEIIDNTVRINELATEAEKFVNSKKYQQAITRYEAILKIEPGNEPATMKLADARKRLAASKSNQESGKITYTVKSGDSLWKIAKKYPGVSDKDIMKWNKCGEDIRPGQKLVIHTGKK